MSAVTHVHRFEVEPRHTAHVLGNDGVMVLGTPFLLLFMELTSQYLIEKLEGAGTISVGISADFKHLAATAVGNFVTVTSILTEQDRKRYAFDVSAEDETGLIGEGMHERFRIDNLDKFLAQTNARG